MDDVRFKTFSPPMQHEPRSERQEHQGQNGYKTLRLSLSQTHQSNYEPGVCFTRLLPVRLGRSEHRDLTAPPWFTLRAQHFRSSPRQNHKVFEAQTYGCFDPGVPCGRSQK